MPFLEDPDSSEARELREVFDVWDEAEYSRSGAPCVVTGESATTLRSAFRIPGVFTRRGGCVSASTGGGGCRERRIAIQAGEIKPDRGIHLKDHLGTGVAMGGGYRMQAPASVKLSR